MTLKTLGIGVGCVVLAFGLGWYVGASGRAALANEVEQTTLRADAAEVRASIQDARLSLGDSNFGEARRAIQRARLLAQRVEARLRRLGQADRAGGVQAVIARLDDADRLSGSLDAGAAGAAAEALRTLESSVPTVGP
jgi:hypothetical protein